MADKDKEKSKVDLGLLEEDDEFEEFPAEGKLKANFQIHEYDDMHFLLIFFRLDRRRR
jgi:hypothetical protein